MAIHPWKHGLGRHQANHGKPICSKCRRLCLSLPSSRQELLPMFPNAWMRRLPGAHPKSCLCRQELIASDSLKEFQHKGKTWASAKCKTSAVFFCNQLNSKQHIPFHGKTIWIQNTPINSFCEFSPFVCSAVCYILIAVSAGHSLTVSGVSYLAMSYDVT